MVMFGNMGGFSPITTPFDGYTPPVQAAPAAPSISPSFSQMNGIPSLSGPTQSMAPSFNQMNGIATPPAAPSSGNKWARIADAVGLIGGGIARAGGGQDVYTPMLEQRRQLQWQMGKQAQQQALEYQRQQALAQWNRDHPAPTAMMLDYNFIGQQQGHDAADRYLSLQSDPMVTTTLPGDNFYSGPRSQLTPALAGMGFSQVAQPPAKPVGRLTPIADPRSAPPTMQNTPAPQIGANGMPARLTPQQYAVTVQQLGKAKTDDWMRRNNITIGN